MSTTIDSKVVELRFDNSQFEKGVSGTMSTLDKLKTKLDFKGATKGLEDVSAASKNVNMSNLGSSVDSVQAKFSALQVVGMTALSNITNSAVDAGKRMLKALTIDPVKAGFSEYELKMDSIKTIMASTGESVDNVNKYLEELNEYSDQTIYSFSDMTQNIGKFTNAGVKLEDAVLAIKGISNEAAVSGANANEASRAMYNFAQALSAGHVKLIDWKSIENANMATVEFKQQLIDSAVAAGTLTEAGEGMYKTLSGKTLSATQNFNDTLQEQWMTSDVLIGTLKQYADANTEIGAKAMAAAQDVTKLSQVFDVLKETAQSGWAKTWELIIGNIDEAKSVLTPFSNALNSIVDGMSDARNRVLEIALHFTKPWTQVSEKIAKVRSSFEGVTNTIKGVSGAISNVTGVVSSIGDKFKSGAEAVDYYQKIVRSVWRGNWKHSDTGRYQLLDAAGYDHRVVQDLVNLGSRHKITIEDIERSHAKFGLTMTTTAEETEKVTQAVAELSDEQLKNAGLTEEEISLYRAVEAEAARAGVSFEEFSEKMSKTSGRDLLFESLGNIGSTLMGFGKAIKEAFADAFDIPSLEVIGIRLYGLLERFRKFTESIRLTDKETGKLNETGQKLSRAFKGIFAIADILLTIFGTGFRIVFKIVGQVLKFFGKSLLDVAAIVGDALTKFHDWFESLFDISGILEVVVPWIQKCAKALGDWFAAFKASKGMQNIIKYIKGIGSGIRDWWASLKESENLPKTIAEGIVNFFSSIPKAIATIFKNLWSAITGSFNSAGSGESLFSGLISKIRSGLSFVGNLFAELGKLILKKLNGFLSARGFATISEDSIAGLINGLKSGAKKVWAVAGDLARGVLDFVKNVLGIHSPSREFAKVGTQMTDGLIVGLKDGAAGVWNFIKNIFSTIIGWIKQIDFGSVFAAVIGLAMTRAANKFADGVASFGEAAATLSEGLGKVMLNVGRVLKGFAKNLKAQAFEHYANGIKNLAIALAILVAALVVLAYVCGKDNFNVWEAVGVIAVLAVVLGVLAASVKLISKSSMSIGKDGVQMAGLSTGLLSIGAALLLVALTVKAIGAMNPQEAQAGFKALIGIVVLLVGLVAAFKFLATPDTAMTMKAAGGAILKISIAMLLLVSVAKKIAKMEWGAMGKAAIGMTFLVGIVAALIVVTKMAGPYAGAIGGTILKISLAMYILVMVAKSIAKMEWEAMAKGAIGMAGLVAIIAALILATRLAGPNPAKIGGTILGISVAMLLLAGVTRILGGMDEATLKKGVGVISIFAALIAGLMAALKLVGPNPAKIAGTILSMSVAIGLLALIAVILGFVDSENLKKGVAAVGALASMVALMISACRGVKNVTSTLLMLVAAVAVMAGAIIALTFLDSKKVAVATAALSAVIGMFSLLIFATRFLKTGEKTFKRNLTTLAVLTGVVVVLAGVIVLLSQCDPNSVLPTTIALSTLMLALTAVMFIISKINTRSAKKAMKGALALTAMLVPLMAFAAALYFMPNLSNAGSNLKVLLPVMAAMLALLVPLTLIGKLGGFKALVGVLALTAMVVPLAAFCLALHLLPDVSGAEANVKLLVGLMTAMTILLIPLTIIGFLSAGAFLGIAALTAMLIPLVAFCLALYLLPDVTGATGNVKLLVGMLDAIAEILIKLAPLAPLAVVGVAAIYALTPLLIAFGVLAAALAGLNSWFPDLQTFLATGIDLLVQIAAGLGEMIGAFITALAGELLQILPMLGESLSQFMINATPFIIGARMVDESVLAGAGILAAAILALTVAELINGIASFINFGSSLADLGTQLSLFMLNATPFIMGARLVTPETLAGVKALAETILLLTAANILDGIASFIGGGSSLESFGAQLALLGDGLSKFSASLGTFTDEQVATVNAAAQAVKALAQASAAIPNTGGLLADIVGENDLGAFASQFPILGMGLKMFLLTLGTFTPDQQATVTAAAEAVKTLAAASAEIPNTGGLLADIVGDNDLTSFANMFPVLGSGIRDFLTNIGTFTGDEQGTVTAAAEAVKSLASVASEIPNTGGLLASIVGDNDLESFANMFPALGEGIRGFLDKIGTFTEDEQATVTCAAEAVKTLASVADEIPNSGGFCGWIVGNNDLDDFAAMFPKVGEGIKGFTDKLGTFNKDKVNTVKAGIAVIQSLTSLANTDLDDLDDNLGDFGDGAASFATKISAFCTNLPSSELMGTAVDTINKLIHIVGRIADANSGVLATFATNLGKISADAVKRFVRAFSDSNAIATLGSAATNLAAKAISSAKTKASEASSVGKALVDGFVSGINKNTYKAEAEAKAMADAAYKAAKKQLNVNSPSKVFRALGYTVPEGFAMGIDKMGDMVTDSSVAMAKTAINNVSNSIANISKMVNSDIDAQPTIRPVLDLSDVRSGAAALGSMLDMNSSVGVSAHIGAISSMMTQHGQNGANAEIVSAIDKLNKRMDNLGNTTYQINGITYDDGSNISDAVATLVRAAKIERRV